MDENEAKKKEKKEKEFAFGVLMSPYHRHPISPTPSCVSATTVSHPIQSTAFLPLRYAISSHPIPLHHMQPIIVCWRRTV